MLTSAGLMKSLAYSLYLSNSCLVVVETGCILILEGLSFLGDGSTVHGFRVGFSLVAILQLEGEAYFLHEVSMTGDAETASAGISL